MRKTAEPSQLTLGLGLRDEATFEHFYAARNEELISELKQTASGKGERVFYLCGARGEGCSHLLQAACHYAHQHHITSLYLPFSHFLSFNPDVLMGLELLQLVCLDDIHLIAGKKQWEEAVFHLYNRIGDVGGRMVISANDLPKALHLTLPDLISRLSAGVLFQLHPLSDEEKLTVLTSRANRRGIGLSEEVAKFILTHSSRDMGQLMMALDTLDNASLAAHRRLTIPFVKEILEI